jgi:signal transduction histidine kinase
VDVHWARHCSGNVALTRRGLLLAGATLFTALVLASGAFAWLQVESRVLAAAEAEGRALLQAVASGVESTLEASRALETALAERLLLLAPELEERLVARPGREAEVLRAFAAGQGLRGAVLLDDAFAVRASSNPERPPGRPGTGAFSARRLDRLETDALARLAREAGLDRLDTVVLGFGDNPIRPRTELLVGARTPRLGGAVLLRLDARDLERFREEAGVRHLLREAARAEAISYLDLRGADGEVLAADDPSREGRIIPTGSAGSAWRRDTAEVRVLDVALPAPWKDEPGGSLHVGLVAAPVDAVLERARWSIAIATLLVLGIGHGGLALLVSRARRMRRREEALRRELEARERFASLGRLAAGMAHEVRSPLNAISMAAQRLVREGAPAEGPASDRFEELTSALRAGIRRLDGTVEEFLDLGRPRPADLRDLQLAALVERIAAEEDPEAVLVPPGEPVVVRADEERLGKALANLLRNARQAAPEGRVEIEWNLAGPDVVLRVCDDGPGIPPEERDRVFEPFRTRRPGGTGLGLTIARDGVERQGGTITVDAAPGGGARFTIRLPTGGRG